MNWESAEKVAFDFLTAEKEKFSVGDHIQVTQEGFQDLGILNKKGEVKQSLGRGWYLIQLEDGKQYKLFSGEGWADFEKI